MNHICQITPGCLCCASDNGSVQSQRQALHDLSLCDLFPVFLISQNYMSIPSCPEWKKETLFGLIPEARRKATGIKQGHAVV